MHKEQLFARFRSAGYRLTEQRIALLDVILAFEGHFTAEMVRTMVAERVPGVDPSTIYRTLELLCEMGVVQACYGSNPTEYERVSEPHHHIVCDRCGTVTAIADRHFERLARELVETYAFQARFDHLAIPGHCLNCSELVHEGE